MMTMMKNFTGGMGFHGGIRGNAARLRHVGLKGRQTRVFQSCIYARNAPAGASRRFLLMQHCFNPVC